MDINIMKKIFRATQPELKTALEKLFTDSNRDVQVGDGYLYSKGSHPVLLVAHLDTVHKQRVNTIMMSEDGTKIMSLEGIGGDDRCGVIIILDILEKLDCSVVFLEDEEIGCVGAKKFCKSGIDIGEVNYAVEFDRKNGNDYVFYKDYNKDFEEHIKKFGFVKGNGSCSDISYIAPEFKIEAVNISCGYYNPHLWYEYVNITEMQDITDRATKMIAETTPKFDYVEEKIAKVISYANGSAKNSWGYGYGYDRYYYDGTLDDYYSRLSNNRVQEEYPSMYVDSGQAILTVKKIAKKFKRIYIDESNNLYWDEDLKNKIVDAELFHPKYNYVMKYWSVRTLFHDQTIKSLEDKTKKEIFAAYITPKDFKLFVDGKVTTFRMIYMDENNKVYEDVLLCQEIKNAEITDLYAYEPFTFKDIELYYPKNIYRVDSKTREAKKNDKK